MREGIYCEVKMYRLQVLQNCTSALEYFLPVSSHGAYDIPSLNNSSDVPAVHSQLCMLAQHAESVPCHAVSTTGEFGIVYKAHLTHWHGEGPTKTVAVKTLKGTVLYM